MYQVSGTEVNGPIVQGFMLICLGVVLCLMFAIVVGARVVITSNVIVLIFLVFRLP